MLFPPVDPNERFRERRAAERRRKRRRRAAVFGVELTAVALLGAGAQWMGGDGAPRTAADLSTVPRGPSGGARPLPVEIRGVHVTAPLASLPGKLDEYLSLQKDGLTALELDVKDENGDVGFVPKTVPLARSIGAARRYYEPRAVARRVHAKGLYLVGRIVTFEDPVLSHARPELAIHRSDGTPWRDAAGLGWTNPYDKRVWDYNVGLAVAAARAGFDEIMFDYVRFPSDGDVGSTVFRNPRHLGKRAAVPAFLDYAARKLRRYDVRVGAAVFGLSAARDMGIGQLPGRIAPNVDTIYAMTYPSLFGAGELGIRDPSAAPGETVTRALRLFRKRLRGTDALLVPWVQDFSFSTPYDLEKVRAQVDAARRSGAKGFMLWNAEGVYTSDALAGP